MSEARARGLAGTLNREDEDGFTYRALPAGPCPEGVANPCHTRLFYVEVREHGHLVGNM